MFDANNDGKISKQEVPLRGMILYHFRDLLVEQLIDMVQAINRIVASSTHKLYEIESSLDQKFAGMISEEVKEQIDLTSAQTHSQTINEIQEKIDNSQRRLREQIHMCLVHNKCMVSGCGFMTV